MPNSRTAAALLVVLVTPLVALATDAQPRPGCPRGPNNGLPNLPGSEPAGTPSSNPSGLPDITPRDIPTFPGKPAVTPGGAEPGARAETTSSMRWETWWDHNRARLVEEAVALRLARASVTPSAGGPNRRDARRERLADAEMLGEIAVPLLLEALDDRDRDVRASAAVAIGRSRNRAAGALLRATAVNDRDPHVRECALVALGLVARGDEVTTLTNVLTDRKSRAQERQIAAVALGLAERAGATPLLAALSAQPSPHKDLRAAIVAALGLTASDDALKPLRLGLSTDAGWDELSRSYALISLARLDDRSVLPLAITTLGFDGRVEMRRAAAIAVARLAGEDDAKAVEALLTAYRKDTDGPTRRLAVLGLGGLGAAAGTEALTDLYAKCEEDDPTRPFLALALGRARATGKAAAALRGDIEKTTAPSDEGAYCVALGLAADGSSRALLEERLADTGSAWRQAHAGFALAMLGGDASRDALRAAIDTTDDPELLVSLARALTVLGDGAAVKGLTTALETGTDTARRAGSARALGELHAAEALPALAAMLGDRKQPSAVRAACAAALGRLCATTDDAPLGRLTSDDNYAAEFDPIIRTREILTAR